MNQREAKRRCCSIAARLLERGGDYPQALYEDDNGNERTYDDAHRMEQAWAELIEELNRRAREHRDD